MSSGDTGWLSAHPSSKDCCTARALKRRDPAARGLVGLRRPERLHAPSLHPPHQTHQVAQDAGGPFVGGPQCAWRAKTCDEEDRSCLLPSLTRFRRDWGWGRRRHPKGAIVLRGPLRRAPGHPSASSSQSCHPLRAAALRDALYKTAERLFRRLKRTPDSASLSKHHAILEYLPGGPAAKALRFEGKEQRFDSYQGAKVPPAAVKNKTATIETAHSFHR